MSAALNKTGLLAANVSALDDPSLYAEAYAAATQERKTRLDRYRRETDKKLSLGAELLLRTAFRENGLEFPSAFDYGKNGKPYAEGCALQFNLSHSGSWVLCAYSDDDVGCDIEMIRPADIKTARHFAEEEYKNILSQKDEAARLDLFFRYWTLKESFMKATGLGMRLSLGDFTIHTEPRVSVTQSVDGREYYFSEFSSVPGCKCALCTAGHPGCAEITSADLREILLHL